MASKKVIKSDNCLNCGRKLNGEDYCPDCGQLNDSSRPGFWSFISESLSSFLAFDGRFFRTVKNLFFKPGKVAREYIAGKKVSYLPPLRVYFISSIILLFLISYSGKDSKIVEINTNANEEITEQDTSNGEDVDEYGFITSDETFNNMRKVARQYPDLSSSDALDTLGLKNGFDNRIVYNIAHKSIYMDAQEFSRYFSSKLFWVFFLFLPFFTLWISLLYIRRDFYYLEHLFFAFYTQSVLFFLVSIGQVLSLIGFKWGVILSIALFGVYLFMALKRFYNQGTGKTILKYILLSSGFLALGAVFLVLSVVVSFILW